MSGGSLFGSRPIKFVPHFLCAGFFLSCLPGRRLVNLANRLWYDRHFRWQYLTLFVKCWILPYHGKELRCYTGYFLVLLVKRNLSIAIIPVLPSFRWSSGRTPSICSTRPTICTGVDFRRLVKDACTLPRCTRKRNCPFVICGLRLYAWQSNLGFAPSNRSAHYWTLLVWK